MVPLNIQAVGYTPNNWVGQMASVRSKLCRIDNRPCLDRSGIEQIQLEGSRIAQGSSLRVRMKYGMLLRVVA
jgi:hypothetical protein